MRARELSRLRKMYVNVRDQLIRTLNSSDCEVDVAGDLVDKIQGKNLVQVQNELSRKNSIRLKALEKAIEMIDENNYGFCEECGEPIGLKRLEALPGITLCISCAEQAERTL